MSFCTPRILNVLYRITYVESPVVGAKLPRRNYSKFSTRTQHHSKPIWNPPRSTQCLRSSTRTVSSILHANAQDLFSRFNGQSIRFLHHTRPTMEHRAFIALGSNMGDRIKMIEEACKLMDQTGKIRILRTSSLWETKAMYVIDQDKFVNGVCEVETSLSPLSLLDELQAIESKMGRVKIIDKGPRNIDLDILLYNNSIFSNDRLQIPHALMLEREFVLRPLCQLIPDVSMTTQGDLPAGSFQSHLLRLPTSEESLSTLTPLCPTLPHLTSTRFGRDTRVMAILNITPDSFSDGGKHFNVESSKLTEIIKSAIAAGATILDVGGQSTRPGSRQVSSAEEINRVEPVIKLIRSLPEAKNVAVSIDTYRADVAKQAIQAGADIVNDVRAGLMDDAMLSTVAQLGCTVCLMHMRGTPETMMTLSHYPNGVIETVGQELVDRVRAAEAAGIRRWRIILDPGIGFAKNRTQNLELLRRLNELRHYPGLQGLPWLVGTSRKAFIGHITDVKDPSERKWGTAAAVTAAIQGGADLVRVHDVQQMVKVAKMADAIWRV